MENFEMNTTLFFVSILVLFVFFIVTYINIIRPFSANKKYIEAEIDRATDKSEKLYWKNELKKLCFIYILIIGEALAKHYCDQSYTYNNSNKN